MVAALGKPQAMISEDEDGASTGQFSITERFHNSIYVYEYDEDGCVLF